MNTLKLCWLTCISVFFLVFDCFADDGAKRSGFIMTPAQVKEIRDLRPRTRERVEEILGVPGEKKEVPRAFAGQGEMYTWVDSKGEWITIYIGYKGSGSLSVSEGLLKAMSK